MQNNKRFITHALGFPRFGTQRELKFATEKFWQGSIAEKELVELGKQIRKKNWLLQKEKGIDLIPSNDFSFYDHVLDTIALYGTVPTRFRWDNEGGVVNFDTYFAMARGVQEKEVEQGKETQYALEMVKWFDTNYHYLVPEFHEDTVFTLASTKVFDEFKEALELGIKTKPVLLSPVSFLRLGKSKDNTNQMDLLPKLLDSFVTVVTTLESLGAEWIQIDEPILVADLTKPELQAIDLTFKILRSKLAGTAKIMLAAYFDDLGSNTDWVCNLAVDAIHIDLTRGSTDVWKVSKMLLESDKFLSLGCVDGRNIWKMQYSKVMSKIQPALDVLSPEKLMLATSCSLIHVPISLENEPQLKIRNILSFATEKLSEIDTLKKALLNDPDAKRELQEIEEEWEKFLSLPELNDATVLNRVTNLKPEDLQRKAPYSIRRQEQRKVCPLPLFPTTTIGSFPQTTDTRQHRLRFKKKQISEEEYKDFIRDQIKSAIELQERIGLDVLVHGEFERNDMVEYFGEMLAGFTFTTNGWVQSFGSRYVKPPIIYGDVSRPRAMSVEWISYAKSLTKLPVKAILTGPITMMQWSFVREDQPKVQTATQLALAIRDEVADLERAGVSIIQVDEPAFREGLPLKKDRRKEYLKWASDAFKLAVCTVQNQTQIHTHMCYGEFADIIEEIANLDADTIMIECSRSQMKLLNIFAQYQYPNDIGPGVFDIHSPRVPSVQEVVDLLQKAAKVIPPSQLWVNPDCGLKTRQWGEVEKSLSNMVIAAKQLRGRHSNK